MTVSRLTPLEQLRQRIPGLVLTLFALGATPASGADEVTTLDSAYSLHGLTHQPLDPSATGALGSEEAAFLEALFALTDRAVLLNTNVALWMSTDGARGLHAADYRIESAALHAELESLPAPLHAVSVRDYVAESLQLQRGFWGEWHAANGEGRPFTSQLTDEYAYHEGLHRSQRLLLKAFAELRALFPHTNEELRESFRTHLHAMSAN